MGVIRYIAGPPYPRWKKFWYSYQFDPLWTTRGKQYLIIQIFCDTTSCGLINSYWRFGGACYLHLQLKPTLLAQLWKWRKQLVRYISGYLPVERASYSRRLEYLQQHLISRNETFARNWLSSHCLFSFDWLSLNGTRFYRPVDCRLFRTDNTKEWLAVTFRNDRFSVWRKDSK